MGINRCDIIMFGCQYTEQEYIEAIPDSRDRAEIDQDTHINACTSDFNPSWLYIAPDNLGNRFLVIGYIVMKHARDDGNLQRTPLNLSKLSIECVNVHGPALESAIRDYGLPVRPAVLYYFCYLA